MCGIAGAFGPLASPPQRIDRALATMRNRGPDAHAARVIDAAGGVVTLLHSRLAIIDIDHRSDQPFEKGGCVLIFNGEIYNYVELRAELTALGHHFTTTGDTEVIIDAYREWGLGCLDRFEGMWAFALFDGRRQELILSRDPFGEKPLYWMVAEGTLYFASEIKALIALSGVKPEIDERQICRYLVNGYKSLFKGDATFFRGVGQLPPASVDVFAAPRSPAPRVFWRMGYRPDESMSMETALAGARERLFEAIRIRLRADVKIAFRLSGGIDSNVLAAVAAKHFGQAIHTFSIYEGDDRYNESDNIECSVAALGCDHHPIRVPRVHFVDRLRDLAAYYDGPVSTISFYLHSFLSEAIRTAGYKVAIAGTGADELFTGYYDHYLFWLADQHGRPDFPRLVEDWRESYGRWVRNPLLQNPLAFVETPEQRDHIFLDADMFAGFLKVPFAEAFTESGYSANLLRNRMLNELYHEAVPVLLHDDDLNSMRYSIENRSPYLDRRLAEFLATVPNRHLIHDGYPKYLLRAAAAGLVPDTVLFDKRKRGFNAPITSVMDVGDPLTRAFLLGESPIFRLVDRAAIESVVEGDLGSNSRSKFLFYFASAKAFLDNYGSLVP